MGNDRDKSEGQARQERVARRMAGFYGTLMVEATDPVAREDARRNCEEWIALSKEAAAGKFVR